MSDDDTHEISVGLTLHQVVLTDPNQLSFRYEPLQCIRWQHEPRTRFTQGRWMNTTNTQTPDQFIENTANSILWHGLVLWKSQTVTTLLESSLNTQGRDEGLHDPIRWLGFEHGPQFGQGSTVK